VLELCQGNTSFLYNNILFIYGGTLFTLGRKMSSSDVLTVVYWARQVGEAIQYLHSREDPLVKYSI
jgi:serine/threonine protein kinase